jgi:predicted dehydrogenase
MAYSNISIGIIGLGSIGNRHLNELKELGVNHIYALRTNKGAKNDKDITVNHVFDPKEFLSLDLDGYIISNPTSLHIQTLELLEGKNKPVFIEKPVSGKLNEVLNTSFLRKDLIQVGFCLRYHDLFQKVKEIINSKRLGDVYHARFNVGQYLPSWHPYTDYRSEYFSQEKLGGGAIRTLSHEIDLALYFFGRPNKYKVFAEKVSNLEIDVDDYSLLFLSYPNLLCRIEIDFLNKKKERKGVIFGTKLDLHYDLFNRQIKVISEKGELVEDIVINETNMYNNQMTGFLNFVENKRKDATASNWEDNLLITEIIENEQSI